MMSLGRRGGRVVASLQRRRAGLAPLLVSLDRARRASTRPAAVAAVTLVLMLAGVGEGLAAGAQEYDPEGRLAELGIELQEPAAPVANYVRAVTTGDLVFLAGHGPSRPDGSYVTGKVGDDLTEEEGYEAARLTAISLLSSLKEEIGDLSRVRRIVRVFGMVNAPSDFTRQPQVINGASDLLVEVFGEERGKHARAAVGMASLPIGIAVEIEMVVEVEPE